MNKKLFLSSIKDIGVTPPLTDWLCREAPESVPEEPRETLCAGLSLRVNWKARGTWSRDDECISKELKSFLSMNFNDFNVLFNEFSMSFKKF